MAVSDASQPRVGGARAAPHRPLRDSCLRVGAGEGWRVACGQDERRRAARAARDAPTSSRGLAVRASAPAGRRFERGRTCNKKSFGES